MATYDLGGVVRRAQQMNGVQQGMLLVGVLGSALLLASMGRPDVQEVSFQHFRTHLLANGVVDHIEVSNKAAAKVFVRPGSQRCAARARTAVFLGQRLMVRLRLEDFALKRLSLDVAQGCLSKIMWCSSHRVQWQEGRCA